MVRRGMFDDQPDCQASFGSHLSRVYSVSPAVSVWIFCFVRVFLRGLITGILVLTGMEQNNKWFLQSLCWRSQSGNNSDKVMYV